MKVLQLLPALNSGGVERGTLEIAKALVEAGHESYVMSAGGRLVQQLEREGSTHITRPIHRKSLTSLLQILPLRRLLRELKPDIVHARSRIPAWIAWLALRGMDPTTRPRFITTVHGLNSVSPYSAIMTKGDAVIVVSQTVYDFVRQNYPSCPPEKLHLIYRGVDPEEFPFGYQPSNEWLAQWHSDFPELAGKTILALPGRITRLKGHETFLKLLAELLPRHPQIHGLIIGGAEAKKTKYLDELKALVAHLGLDGRVTFTGHRSDMRDALSQCSVVFALSTKPETFGRAVLETLRLGVPVIGWDVGGVGEILRAVYPEGAVQINQHNLASTSSNMIYSRLKPRISNDFLLVTMYKSTLATYLKTKLKKDKLDNYYNGTRPEVFSQISSFVFPGIKVLEIGCGKGGFIKNFSTPCEYWGVEPETNAYNEASLVMHRCFNGTFSEVYEELPKDYFDLIICNDVIEHIDSYMRFISSTKSKLNTNGILVGSVPNVRYIFNLKEILIRKDWEYRSEGILDCTHLRFFTKKSLVRSLESSGYQIDLIKGINGINLRPTSVKKILRAILVFIIGLDTKYLQFLFVAKPIKP